MINKHAELTSLIIKAYYTVYNNLGYGFLEKVYAQAMLIELKKLDLEAVLEEAIPVYYEGQLISEYYADILVAGKVIVELKAAKELAPEHEAQLLNYLKATSYEVGLLFNFGPEPKFKRKTYDNYRKGNLDWSKP